MDFVLVSEIDSFSSLIFEIYLSYVASMIRDDLVCELYNLKIYLHKNNSNFILFLWAYVYMLVCVYVCMRLDVFVCTCVRNPASLVFSSAILWFCFEAWKHFEKTGFY